MKKLILIIFFLTLSAYPALCEESNHADFEKKIHDWRLRQEYLTTPKGKAELEELRTRQEHLKTPKGQIETEIPDAKKGDVSAQLRLCGLYSSVQNYSEAFKWCRKAADNGAFPSYLGEMYEKGLGIEKNLEEAYFWQFMGNELIHSDLRSAWSSEELVKKLTPEQKRSVLKRIAANIDQRDGWFLHLLACENLFTGEYEQAYFWFIALKKDGVDEHINDEDLISNAKEHLTPEQQAAIDKQVLQWQPTYGEAMTQKGRKHADEALLQRKKAREEREQFYHENGLK